MRADAVGTGSVEATKHYGARVALSIGLSVVLAIAVVPMLSAGLPWGFTAGAVVLAIVAGIDAALVTDRMLNAAAPVKATGGRESLGTSDRKKAIQLIPARVKQLQAERAVKYASVSF